MLVSVIIPAFNAALSIEASVRSALDQVDVDVEVIVVNDRSSDLTEDICCSISARDKRLRLLNNTGWQGPSSSRNTAIKASSGEWIALLDADDYMTASRLSGLVAKAESRQLDVLADNLDLVEYETGRSMGRAYPDTMLSRREPIDLAWMLRHDIPGGDYRTFGFCKPIIRAKRLKETDILYDDDLAMGEDYLFYGRLIIAGFRFGVTTSSGYMYSVRKTSLTLTQKDSFEKY